MNINRSQCLQCEALEVSQAAFDESLAKRGVRLEAGVTSTMIIPCVLCGEPRNVRCHGLTPEMQREFTNLRKMIDRDTRLRRKVSDEVMRLWAEFRENHLQRCIALFGLVYAEAHVAAEERLEEWFKQHAEEVIAATLEQQKLNGSN